MLVVVVRYFGGTKLGVPGLINAYREATLDVLENSRIVTRTEDAWYEVVFPYTVMNDVMKVVKEEQPVIREQEFDNRCRMVLSIRRSREEGLKGKLSKVEGTELTFLRNG